MRSFLLALLAAAAAAAQQPANLTSPDGRLAIHFDTSGGKLVYSVTFEGKRLVDPSALALDLQGQRLLGPGLRIVRAAPSEADDNYQLVAGKTSSVHDRYKALRLDLEETNGPGRKLAIEARAFNDAVAFRYVVPGQPAMRDYRLVNEKTEFRMSKDATTYSLILPNYRTMYESEFIKLPVSAFANQGGVSSSPLIGLPLLMDVPGVAWMAITEADLRGNAAMYLENPAANWSGHWFESRISPRDDIPGLCVTGTLPHHTAWRVLLVADDPGRLIESNVITSLNPESEIKDTSWIRAGKAAWDWWSGSADRYGKHAFTTENMKYYVDFAANSGLEYMLVDAGWSARNDITKMNGTVDIPELVRYAAPKKVKIWIWLHWTGVDRQMDEAFPLYEKWGVAGVKIDFMSRDDQAMIDWYYRVAQTAAAHHLMVDFHGATKPWGMERTWPNVLGYEAVLGMEQSKAGARDNPPHRVTLPFTRMLAGPMDYTPGGFDNVTRADFEPRSMKPMVMGTRGQQLAMYAIYDAPFQMISDSPAAYQDQPSFEFIKNAPATWDETKVLNGEPGEYITMARRKGKDWYLGSMTNWSARELDLPLSFLGPGHYRAEIYADASDADHLPKNVSIQKKQVDRNTHLKAQLAPGGGYAVRFVPVE